MNENPPLFEYKFPEEHKNCEVLGKKHCLHHTGTVLTSYPPIDVMYCCHCNSEVRVTRKLIDATEGHGAYLKQHRFFD